MFRSLPPRPRKRQSYASLILPPAIIQLPRPVAAGGEVPRPCRAAPRRAALRSAPLRREALPRAAPAAGQIVSDGPETSALPVTSP